MSLNKNKKSKVSVCPIMLQEVINELKWKKKQVETKNRELEIFDGMMYLALQSRKKGIIGGCSPCPITEMEMALEEYKLNKGPTS